MRVEFNLYPGKADHVLTMSYDDGTIHDRRLVEIFDKYGIRGTFHLNSGRLDKEGALTKAEVKPLFKNHEISSHTVTHPFPEMISGSELLRESFEDKKTLEELAGYVVRGMSYPYGNYGEKSIEIFKAVGMEYSRTTRSTGAYAFPDEPMTWHPTCHHRDNLLDRLDTFYEPTKYENGKLFYVWGHSYEFNNNNNWELIEEFCKRAAGRENTWYATNIEIIDYMNAQKAIRVSADGKMFFNPTSTDVWVHADKEPVLLPAGKTTLL